MNARKKILYVASRVPFPPNKGEKIRTFRCLDHLASNHDVYCAFFTDGPEDNSHVESIRQWCVDIAAVPRPPRPTLLGMIDLLARGHSVSMAAHRSEELADRISSWRKKVDFDIAVAFSAFMAPYALAAGATRNVLDLCDCDSEKWREYGMRSPWPMSSFWTTESSLLRETEARLIAQFDAAIVINERERHALNWQDSSVPIHVVPNGVERPATLPPPASAVGPIVTFIGAMDYRPNIDGVRWFTAKVWPRIQRSNPDALFLIAGHRPTRVVQKLGEHPGVRVLGAFESLDELLTKTRVIVTPLRIARGMQNKVLEAMAWRRPVVATKAVADGLLAAHGELLLTADNPVEMATQVMELLTNGKQADAVADRGYRYVTAFHRWPEHLGMFERIAMGIGRQFDPVVPADEIGSVATALADMASEEPEGTANSRGTFDESRTSVRRRRRPFSVSAFVESAT